MPVDRSLWARPLGKYYAPPWPCPRCATGKLQLRRDSLQYNETADSKSANSEHWDYMSISLVFSAWLECDKCREVIACCGNSGYEPYEAQNEDGEYQIDYEIQHYPRFFSTPMLLFRIPASCPIKIRDALIRSFNMAFCDYAAAANHMRQCVEELLTHLGIANKQSSGKFRSLGERIDEVSNVNPRNSARLSALRWIGNFGSHPEDLKRDDIFDAYDILELILEDIFVGHHRSTEAKIAEINTRRQPRG